MRSSYSFADLAKEVLENEGRPLSAVEIWEAAVASGLDKKKATAGKTPDRSIGAQIYTDIRDNPETPFVQVSKRPALFCLKGLSLSGEQLEEEKDPSKSKVKRWAEKDLHPLLATFVRSDERFRCATMTISEKKSKRGSYQNADKWTHPDMVGIHYPFGDYEDRTIDLIEALRENPYTLYSFELKKEIEPSQLREYYFQTVSNSSWANEGYLVAERVSRDSDFLDDLQRLVNAFGIGVVELDIDNIEQSEVLYPARRNQSIDWATVNRIAGMNRDFQDFIANVVSSAKAGEEVAGRHKYDETIKPEKYEEYLVDHGFSVDE